ncbi:MAG: Ig-like domain-containing protein [Lacrimispora sphenoides]
MNGVDVTWNSIPGATSYSVERSTTAGGPYTPIASDLTETSYRDKSVVANTTYYYIVKARLSDTETITSAEVSAVPTSDTPTVDSKLKVVLEPEEKLQLSVDDHLDENTNMTWTSSDNTVAQVDANGVVTAIKAGNAVIHVQSPDGNYSDDINILVVDNADDYRLAVDLKVGKTSRLTVDDLTNTLNVTWNSSDATVATVSSKGVITAKRKGLTLAKATDKDGNLVGQVYVRVRE